MESEFRFKIGGFVAGALAALVALAIIFSSVGQRPEVKAESEQLTFPLGDAASSVWTLLAACAVVGLILSAIGRRRRRAGAGVTSPPAVAAGGSDPLEVVQVYAEVALMILGGLSAVVIFLDGIRLRVILRDPNAVWSMFLVCSALLILSATKGAAIRRWFARERADEPDGGWQAGRYD